MSTVQTIFQVGNETKNEKALGLYEFHSGENECKLVGKSLIHRAGCAGSSARRGGRPLEIQATSELATAQSRHQ